MVDVIDRFSMYLWAQSQNMPLSPGILWTRVGKSFKKSIMRAGTSFGAMQWLYYIQATECFDKNGNRVQLQHHYFNDEHSECGYQPDGFAIIDGEYVFYEYLGNICHIIWFILTIYLGCAFHPDCCVPDEDIPGAETKRDTWNTKKKFMESRGRLVVMRECVWKQQIKQLPIVETDMPRILMNDNEQSLLNAIENGDVFGFCTVDVTTPQEIIEERKAAGFLFPPIIRRMVIEEQHLSDFTKQQFQNQNRKLKNEETVVQTYNGTQVFVMTEMVRVWMKMGLKISNVTQFIQYIPGKTLLPFTQKVTKMRVQATYEKDEAKATTAKLYGNSGNSLCHIVYMICEFLVGYGKCGENVERYTNTKIAYTAEELRKEDAKALFRDYEEFLDENGIPVAYEIKMARPSIEDVKPVHVSVCILQWSKILFLK